MMISDPAEEGGDGIVSWINLTGMTTGVAIMYATALLVSI